MDMMFLPPGANEQERREQIRVYALSMAGRDYPGTGRHDGVLKLASEYEKWIVGSGDAQVISTKPATAFTLADLGQGAQQSKQPQPQQPAPAPAGDGSGANDGDRDASHDVGGVRDGGGAPASVRQAARKG